MKTIIVLSLCFIAVNSALLNTETWTSTKKNQFSSMSIAELSKFTGTFIPPKAKLSAGRFVNLTDLPTNFKAAEKWPSCIHPIRDQESCGSCWAFGASEAFSDRVCIATNGASNFVLSPEDLVSCDTNNYGCGGGYLELAWDYIVENGLVSDSCFPYTAGSGIAPTCQTTCSDSELWTVYFANNVRDLTADEGALEIFTNGPIETAFYVYEDFFSYTGGVYTQTSNNFVGGHAIKVVGWGHDEETGLDYWLAANSWGTGWGINGFFKIAKGECGFDDNFIVGDYAGSGSFFSKPTNFLN